MFKMRKVVIVLVGLIALIGCSKNNPMGPNKSKDKGRVEMSLDVTSRIASGKVTISKDNEEHSKEVDINNYSGQVSFVNVSSGQWEVEAILYDESGEELYNGKREIEVVKGQTTLASLRLEPSTDKVVIEIVVPREGELLVEDFELGEKNGWQGCRLGNILDRTSIYKNSRVAYNGQYFISLEIFKSYTYSRIYKKFSENKNFSTASEVKMRVRLNKADGDELGKEVKIYPYIKIVEEDGSIRKIKNQQDLVKTTKTDVWHRIEMNFYDNRITVQQLSKVVEIGVETECRQSGETFEILVDDIKVVE